MAPTKRVSGKSKDEDENVAPISTSNTTKAVAKAVPIRRYATRAATRRALADVANRVSTTTTNAINVEKRPKNNDFNKQVVKTQDARYSPPYPLPNNSTSSDAVDGAINTTNAEKCPENNQMINVQNINCTLPSPVLNVPAPDNILNRVINTTKSINALKRPADNHSTTDNTCVAPLLNCSIPDDDANSTLVVASSKAEKRPKNNGTMKKVVKKIQGNTCVPFLRNRSTPNSSIVKLATITISPKDDAMIDEHETLDLTPKGEKQSNGIRWYSLETEALPRNVVDIDAKDLGNTLTEYSHAVQVHRNLVIREVDTMAPSNYLDGRDITGNMRRILVDWLVDVHEQYALSNGTLHLAVNILDRFLASNEVSRSRLQLVGVAAAWLASKYEEIYPPSLADFVYIADGTYTAEEVEHMEALVLNSLEWRITVPTMPMFTARVLKALRVDDVHSMRHFADYACELVLCDVHSLVWRPSQIAAAVAALAARLFVPYNLVWDQTLQFHSGGYNIPQLENCISHVWRLVQQDHASAGRLDAVHRKYSKSRFERISLLAPTLDPTEPKFQRIALHALLLDPDVPAL